MKSCSMHGDHSHLIENMETIDSLCDKDRTGSNSLRVWRTQNFRIVQEHIGHKVILGFISYIKPQTSCRHCKKNTYQRETR